MADDISELRIVDAELRRDLSTVREQVRGISVDLGHKADRSELHQFKEAIFDRLETLVSRVVVDHENKTTERMKVFGHENADVIRNEVDRALRERDRLEAEAKAKAISKAADVATARNKGTNTVDGISPKHAAWLAFASLAFGLFLSQYAMPLLIQFARHALGV